MGAAGELQVQFAFQFAGFEAVHVAGQMIGFGVQWCAVGGQQVDPGGFDQGEHFGAELQVEAFGAAVGDQCGEALGAAVQFEFDAVIQAVSLDVANPGQELIARTGTQAQAFHDLQVRLQAAVGAEALEKGLVLALVVLKGFDQLLAGRSQLRTATAFAACAARHQWAAGGAVHGFDGVPGGLVANAHGFGGLGNGAAAGDLGQQFDAALPGQVLAVMGDPELSFELHGAGFLWAVVAILALPCGVAVNPGGASGCVI